MNKLLRLMQNFIVIGIPFLIIFSGVAAINTQNNDFNYFIHNYFGVFLMICFIAWFSVLFLFLLSLVICPQAREKTLKRLANLQERDEREEYITGKAARTSYISTLSLMIFILFLSTFNVCLTKNITDKKDAPHHTLSMGLHFNIFDKQEVNQDPNRIVIFDSKNIVPSTSAILLILLCWQLLSFNLSARKEKVADI